MSEQLPIPEKVIHVADGSAAVPRLVSVEEARIAQSVIDHLAALVGAARVEPLGDVQLRTLTPTANRMADALRAAGYQVTAVGQA